jgi:hypothetical protein
MGEKLTRFILKPEDRISNAIFRKEMARKDDVQLEREAQGKIQIMSADEAISLYTDLEFASFYWQRTEYQIFAISSGLMFLRPIAEKYREKCDEANSRRKLIEESSLYENANKRLHTLGVTYEKRQPKLSSVTATEPLLDTIIKANYLANALDIRPNYAEGIRDACYAELDERGFHLDYVNAPNKRALLEKFHERSHRQKHKL